MPLLTFRRLLRSTSPVVLVALALPLGTPAFAQKTIEGRVDRLEKEMQAVQRKVFPGGAGQIVAPDVTPEIAPPTPAGSPASAPIADLTARVGAIESSLARLTGQVEENGHRLQQLEANYAKLQAQLDAQVAAAEAATAAPPALPVLAPAPVAGGKAAAGSKQTAPGKPAPAAAAQTKSDQARVQAVAAIEQPSTGNAALDSYSYGYRLWQAKFYPEAQAQLEDTVSKYAKDPVASRAANLLGRAYLDDSKPTQAAKTLFENYRLRPKGDRASESLAWVGEALIQLNQLKNACLAYEELKDRFGDTMPANVRDMMTKGRVRAKCGE